MKRGSCISHVALAVAASLCLQARAFQVDIPDATGDSTGLDLTRFSFEIADGAAEIRLSFAQDLESVFGDANGIVDVDLDMDRSLLSGFVAGPESHPRFGVDYRIEIALSGFGPAYAWASLRYWQHRYVAPFLTVDKQEVALGDFMYPNGSVLAVGTDPTYGTDAHQVYVRVPLSLFDNESFPICGDTPICYNILYPCPLPLAQDASKALVCASVRPAVPFTVYDVMDWVPDQGMIDIATGAVVPPFPTGSIDRVTEVSDPAGDPLGGTALNGEDITAFRVYRHQGDIWTFEMDLAGVNMANTALYHVVIDADDNPATGEPFTHGAPLGVDLIAEFAIPDNQVGEASPLEGLLKLWQGGGYCDLWDFDCLGSLSYGSPGHVAISLPGYLLAPYLAANTSGQMKVFTGTSANNLLFTGFDDIAPDSRALSIPLASTTSNSLRIASWQRSEGNTFVLRCLCTEPGLSNILLQSASSVTGPWSNAPATLKTLGGGVYEGRLTNTPTVPQRFFRVAGSR